MTETISLPLAISGESRFDAANRMLSFEMILGPSGRSRINSRKETINNVKMKTTSPPLAVNGASRRRAASLMPAFKSIPECSERSKMMLGQKRQRIMFEIKYTRSLSLSTDDLAIMRRAKSFHSNCSWDTAARTKIVRGVETANDVRMKILSLPLAFDRGFRYDTASRNSLSDCLKDAAVENKYTRGLKIGEIVEIENNAAKSRRSRKNPPLCSESKAIFQIVGLFLECGGQRTP